MNDQWIRSGLIRLVLILSLSATVLPQSLQVRWNKIENFYEQGVYDSVVTNIPPLFAVLEDIKLDSQVVNACFYLEMALMRTGQDRRADSIRQIAEKYAQKHLIAPMLTDFNQDRYTIILDIALDLQKRDSPTRKMKDPERALRLLQRMFAIEDDSLTLNPKLQAYALTGRILKLTGKLTGIKDALEPALKLIRLYDTVNIEARRSILGYLAESYLARGDVDLVYSLKSDFGYPLSFQELIAPAARFLNTPKGKEYDLLFATLQEEYLRSRPDSTAFKYIIAHFVLQSGLYNADAALDSLQSTITYLETFRDTTGQLLFDVYQMYIKKCLENNLMPQANRAFTILERRNSSKNKSGDLNSSVIMLKADILSIRGEYLDAEQLYSGLVPGIEALKTIERLSLLNYLGLCQTALGKVEKGSETFAMLKRYSTNTTDTSAKVKEFRVLAYLNGGRLFLRNDKIDSAIIQFREGQRIAKELNLHSYAALFYIRLADAFRAKGYAQQTFEMYDSLQIAMNTVTDPFQKIQVFESLASFEFEKGNTEKCLRFYYEALDVANRNGFSGSKINLSGNIADVFLQCDSLKRALSLFRVVREAVERNGSKTERYSQNFKMALVFLNSNEFDSARTYIGNCFSLLTNESNPSIDSISSLKTPYPYLLTLTISLLAEVNFFEGQIYGNVTKVKLAYNQAQRAVEYNKNNIADLLTTYQGESVQLLKSIDCYKVLIDIALHLYERTGDEKYKEGAFDACENSRSQAFVSEIGSKVFFSTAEARVDTSTFVQHIAKSLKGKKNTALAKANELSPYSRRRDLDVVADTTRDLLKVQQQYNEFVTNLSKSNSNSAGLLSPGVNVLSLRGIESLLADDEVLLNYYVSRNKTFLFYITKNVSKVIPIELDDKTVIDMCEVYRTVLQSKSDTADMSRGFKTIGQGTNKNSNAQNLNLSSRLYNALIAPVEKDIVNKKLLIVPSSALHAIPFSALKNSQNKYLIETNTVAVLPNASSIQLILKNIKAVPQQSVLALGNPDCGAIASSLPGAEDEVNMIASLFPNSTVYIGADAQEKTVKELISKYSIVHFACHGEFNGDFPLLSRLLLTPGNGEDGNLELRELYDLKLSKCNLVVLSACQSGLAKVKKNDDLIGLVRGFLYAGTPSVIASLWKVDDAATSFMMQKLYYYLSNNFSRGEALQRAQMDTMHSPTFSHPYFWSAFQLNGVGR